MNILKTLLFLCCLVALCNSVTPVKAEDSSDIEVISIFGSRQALQTSTGSGAVLSSADLERFEFDDIHRILQAIPGVYVREEDGYGLRPNIGLRGATTERSSKVTLMEDGVLIAPAPYAAPAAYFFPSVSRMTTIEVFKGPSAIAYGPNTIGGAINMLSRSFGVNAGDEGYIDLALGSDGYRKAHGAYEHHIDQYSAMIEGVHLAADGFKHIPSGGATGFVKNEWLAKVRYQPENDRYNQRWELKFGYAEEESDETYLGLTDADFAVEPFQRYAASKNDKLDWEHYQVQLSHFIELNNSTSVFTQMYRRDFDRDWDRLGGFNGNRSLAAILAAPNRGVNARFMQVLRGEADTLLNEETLLFAMNDRNYYSQGVQSKLIWDGEWQNTEITLEAGIRVHQDQVKRHHRNRMMLMQEAQLVEAGKVDMLSVRNKDEVTAVAGYLNGLMTNGNWYFSAGFRVENMDLKARDFVSNTTKDSSDNVLLPGIGVFYQVSDQLGLLAGVNKGFVPNSPGQHEDIDPEESWNYEAGMRASLNNWQFEMIGFFNDYSNLKGTCTFSSGCTVNADLDREFNAGEVKIWGLEASVGGAFTLSHGWRVPLNIAYTNSKSEFQTSFQSGFSQWGNVSEGDNLPYLPEHQFNLQLGLGNEHWQAQVNYKYIANMQEAAGRATELEAINTAKMSILDLSFWYQLDQHWRGYVKIDNLLNQTNIVSRRPFGARPGKPRQFVLGAKFQF